MNARFLSKVRVGLTVTAMGLCGAYALSTNTGCAGGGDGGSAGNTPTGTGGAGGGGSTGSSCSAGADTVCFKDGQASGPMAGYGWVALGILDSISDPVCDTGAITKEKPCTTQTKWNASDAVCISGKIPALPASPVQKDYDDNWGLQIGVNSAEPPADKGGATLNKTYKTITFNVSGSPTTGLRGELHRKGDDEKVTYCATFKSGEKVTLTAFNTKCWGDATTVLLTEADIPNIDKVGIQVSSGSSAIDVTNLCLKSVEFGN
jgi:hypothetical protein